MCPCEPRDLESAKTPIPLPLLHPSSEVYVLINTPPFFKCSLPPTSSKKARRTSKPAKHMTTVGSKRGRGSKCVTSKKTTVPKPSKPRRRKGKGVSEIRRKLSPCEKECQKLFREHPQLEVKGPFEVQCQLCKADVQLSLDHAYHPGNWLDHIESCRTSRRFKRGRHGKIKPIENSKRVDGSPVRSRSRASKEENARSLESEALELDLLPKSQMTTSSSPTLPLPQLTTVQTSNLPLDIETTKHDINQSSSPIQCVPSSTPVPTQVNFFNSPKRESTTESGSQYSVMTPESCSVELSPVIMDNSDSFKVHSEGNILLPELAETRGDLTKGYHQFDTCVEDSDMKFVKGSQLQNRTTENTETTHTQVKVEAGSQLHLQSLSNTSSEDLDLSSDDEIDRLQFFYPEPESDDEMGV